MKVIIRVNAMELKSKDSEGQAACQGVARNYCWIKYGVFLKLIKRGVDAEIIKEIPLLQLWHLVYFCYYYTFRWFCYLTISDRCCVWNLRNGEEIKEEKEKLVLCTILGFYIFSHFSLRTKQWEIELFFFILFFSISFSKALFTSIICCRVGFSPTFFSRDFE